MKPITKLYLKTFILTGIPYGIIMTMMDPSGAAFNIWKFLALSITFGTIMSFILVSFHAYRLKKNGLNNLTNEDLKVTQTKAVHSNLNQQQFVSRLKSDAKLGKMKITENENGLELKSGMTMRSWGEKIQVNINPAGQNEFDYQISSAPKLKSTLVDYGKNLENVNRIEALIKKDA